MDRNVHKSTFVEMQISEPFDEHRDDQQQQGFHNEERLIESSDSTELNGVLAPRPVSTIRLESGSGFEHLPESYRAQSRKRRLPKWAHSDGAVEPQQETTATISRNRSHPRSLQTDGTMLAGRLESSATRSSNIPTLVSNQVLETELDSWPQQQAVDQASTSSNQVLPSSPPPPPPPPVEKPTSFRLFKIAKSSEAHILEQTMVETGDVYRYQFSVYENDEGNWKGKKSKAPKTEPDLSLDLVVEDSYPSIYVKECEVPFQDRLQGWTFKKKTRPNGITDTFYTHMGRQFRSLVKVSEYIVYSCYTIMVPIQRRYRSQECLEAEAAGVTLMMMFAEIEKLNTRRLTILAETAVLTETAVSEQIEDGSSQPVVDDNRSARPQLEVNQREEEAVQSTAQPDVDCSPDSSIFSNLLDIEDLNLDGLNGVCWPVDNHLFTNVGDLNLTYPK